MGCIFPSGRIACVAGTSRSMIITVAPVISLTKASPSQ